MEYKFNEGEFLKKIEKYIDSTYVAHYTNQNGMQLLEFFDDEKIKAFCQLSASKYILRFGRKNGKDIKDLYKSIHYMLILMYKLEQEECRCSLVGCKDKKQHIHEIKGLGQAKDEIIGGAAGFSNTVFPICGVSPEEDRGYKHSGGVVFEGKHLLDSDPNSNCKSKLHRQIE